MIYCVDCGTANDSDARFCTKCGAELFFPDNEPKAAPKEDEGVIPETVPEEPKKRGRKPKAKPQEEIVTEELAPLEEVSEEPVPMVETDELEQQPKEVKKEPEALEWSTSTKTAPQHNTGYVLPVMPREYNQPNQTYHSTSTVPPGNPYEKRFEDQRIMNSRTKPISTAAYFWLKVLYSIPGIGLFMAIILSVAPANLNLKRFSRATLIYRVLCYVALLIAVLILAIVWQYFDWSWCVEFNRYHGWPNWTIRIM